MSLSFIGRKKPFTKIGIRRKKCQACGKQAAFQWAICANGLRLVPVCKDCDIRLNRLFLEFFGHPDVDALMVAYVRSLNDVE